jgi:hypothetical protein
MNKLASLRAHLLSIPGEITIEPDDLLTFADSGQIISSASGTNEHYEFKYKGNIIISNYSGQADKLAYWLLQWMKANQPDHLDDPIQFEADILNDDSVDLSLTIELNETVKIEQTADGILLHHVDEPSIEPIPLDAATWTLAANGDEVANWIEGG